MKEIIISLILGLSFTFVSSINATEPATPITVPVKEIPKELPNPKGHRMPSASIICTLDQVNGVTLSTVDSSEIVSYELWDLEDNCCFATSIEMDFIDYVFSLAGEHLIKLYSEDSVFIGYLCL